MFAFVVLLVLTIAGGVAARMAGQLGGSTQLGATDRTLEVADPEGAVRFEARVDRARVLEGQDGQVSLQLTIMGLEDGSETTVASRPTDLVVVLDRSGSMQGEPIARALASVRKLIESLDQEDRFALVTYGSSAQTVIPLSRATPGATAQWARTLSSIGVGGGTNMSSGLDRAAAQIANARTVGRATRLVLVSDGHANEGDATREGLVARAANAVVGEYVVSTVGVGEGFDEQLMTALADAGTGNFYYVARSDDLGDIFAGEFASARAQVASALDIEIQPAPGVRVKSAAGYPLETRGAAVGFRPGPLFAGQARRIWVTMHVPTDHPGTTFDLGRIALRYRRDGAERLLPVTGLPEVAVVADRSLFLAGLDGETWAQSVAEDEVGALKQEVARELKDGDRSGAVALMDSFRQKQIALNAAVASPAVDAVIAEVEAMEEEIDQAAASPEPAARKRLQKLYSADGYDSRRSGAKYGPGKRVD